MLNPSKFASAMRPKINSNDFGCFLELISRFEFDFRRCGFFFEGFEFMVCSKFNHTQCALHVHVLWACLCPQNSNSNVVVSVTIHMTRIYIYTFFKDVCECICICMCICIWKCLCLCCCVCIYSVVLVMT